MLVAEVGFKPSMDIREIARRAKVSTATVSRAINRVPTVDPQLAKRVWKVVDELGYYPNTQARALVSGRSRLFGLIVSEITNPFFPEIVQTFENEAVENNYEILLTSTVHDPKRMESSVRRMIERRVDGVAILTFGMEDTLIEHLRFRKVPQVFVDVGPDVPGIANIRINYQNGIRQAVQHLAALGWPKGSLVTLVLASVFTERCRTELLWRFSRLATAPMKLESPPTAGL
jgi:LacI family transcriptional regulator